MIMLQLLTALAALVIAAVEINRKRVSFVVIWSTIFIIVLNVSLVIIHDFGAQD